MKFFEISNLVSLKKDSEERVVALGFFDGLHIAHQEIIEQTVSYAKKENKLATLITFDKSPKEYFSKEKVNLLTPRGQKIKLLENLGIDEVYMLEFNEALRKLSKEEFVTEVLGSLNTVAVFCGYDYLFGYKGEGTSQFITDFTAGKIKVKIVAKKEFNNQKIASTLLREYVIAGEFEKYVELTERPYKIVGEIVQGRQLGRTINFPTANLQVTGDSLIPERLGVYITAVKVHGKYYKGITNIGNNPTVSSEKKLFIETHILDFDMDIYGEEIELNFFEFLRAEQKFNGIEELKAQLQVDKQKAEIFHINLKNMTL